MEFEHEDGQQLVTQLRLLSDKANTGDQAALFELRSMLADDHRLVEHLGDLAQHVETAWLDRVAGNNALMRESVSEHLADMKAQLGGPCPTAIEKLLVDQIAINVVATHHAAYAEATADIGNPKQVALRCKRSESTQKRFLDTVKLLTTLRAFAPAGLQPAEPLTDIRPIARSA